MTNDKRACIAFICGIKVNPYRNRQIIFDIASGRYYHFMIMHRSNSNIHIYEYQMNRHIQGTFDMLFDYRSSYYLNITWNGCHFNGFDYETQCYFMGKVNNDRIELLDYETTSYYIYQII